MSSHITTTVELWKPHGVQDIIGFSASNFVGLMENGCSVLKYPHSPNDLSALREEADRYIRIGSHDNIVTFKGMTNDGLLLEYCERGALHEVTLDISQKLRIAAQVVRGLVHLHKRNFVHCDLNVRNVFVTSDFTAKIGDLQGQLSRSDGTIEMETMGENNVKSRLLAPDGEFSERTDIFAMGTLLYHVWYGHPPWPELDEFRDEGEIERRWREGDFPSGIVASAGGMDKVIRKCWSLEYACASEILDDLSLLSDAQLGE